MSPINFSFVSTFDLNLGDGSSLTILTLDKPANEDYWKRLRCFSTQINELKLSGPEAAEEWIIGKEFAEHLAMIDLAVEQLPELAGMEQVLMGNIPELLKTIYDIPINWVDDIGDWVELKLKDGTTHVNTLWQ